jgi:copper chaperone
MMQFELSTAHPDAAAITAAMRALDPQARVALDTGRGHLEVLASASGAQILDALARIGCTARPLEKEVHISGGSTCCGHCG